MISFCLFLIFSAIWGLIAQALLSAAWDDDPPETTVGNLFAIFIIGPLGWVMFGAIFIWFVLGRDWERYADERGFE